MSRTLVVLVVVLAASRAMAQYSEQAGHNAPVAAKSASADSLGTRSGERRVQPEPAPVVARDAHGNAAGAKYDLAVDGAFGGQTILIVDLYHSQSGIEPVDAVQALKRKGFDVVRYNDVPTVEVLHAGLGKSNQFWIISSCDDQVHLTAEHRKEIKAFFDAGHGVYLWGDNDPCNADADQLARELIDARVKGDVPGDQTVGISQGPGKPGVVRDHLISTGVETVYEGVTVATVKPSGAMTPVIYGSAGNLVTAAFEANGKRMIVDGGFTCIAYKWDTAGTGRYIVNAAAWLANYERFGNQVVAKAFQKK